METTEKCKCGRGMTVVKGLIGQPEPVCNECYKVPWICKCQPLPTKEDEKLWFRKPDGTVNEGYLSERY